MTLETFDRAFANIKIRLVCENKCGAVQPVLSLRKARQLFEMNNLQCHKCSARLAKL